MNSSIPHTPLKSFNRLLIHRVGGAKNLRYAVLLLELIQTFLGDVHDAALMQEVQTLDVLRRSNETRYLYSDLPIC